MKLGVLGGTFDPIHNGHLAIAGEALNKLSLDKVLFVPARQQPLKDRDDITPVENRLRMISLAIKDFPQFALSTVETDRKGPDYTVDTLRILKQQYSDAELYFILGWDSLEELPRWKQPEQIIKLCRIVALTRSTVSRPEIKKLDSEIPGLSQRLVMLDMAPVDISSSDIRHGLRRGLSIQGMVPQGVEDYIIKQGLYKQVLK
jgi:nicotinate-nucleotide adenylyltransferase